MDREKLSDNRTKHVLVLHQGAIGDFILTLSVIQAVSEFLGGADVTVVASAPSARLAAGRSVIRQSFHPDQVGGHGLFQIDGPLDKRLLNLLGQADWVLSFLGGQDERTHARLKAHTRRQVISVNPRPTDETLRQRRHITRQWCDDIRQAGLDIPDPSPPVIRLDDHHRTGHMQETRSRCRIVIHPGSGGRHKCWPVENYFTLADSLRNAEVIWMLGPAEVERDQQLADAVHHRSADNSEPVVIEADLLQAAKMIVSADLYIGNDSGMTHLAAALGVPTIAIFTTTDPAVWAPHGEHIQVMDNRSAGGSLTMERVSQVVREFAYGS